MKTMMWVVTFLAVFFSSIDVQAQSESSKASDETPASNEKLEINKAIDFGDGLSLRPTTKKVTVQCDIRVIFPQFEGPLTPAMQRFNELVKKRLEQETETWNQGCPENDYFQSDYLIHHADRRFVSVLFKGSFLTGGPHPAGFERTLNYDLSADKELMLWDLFKPDSNYLKLISDHAFFKIAQDEALVGNQCVQARGITFPTDAKYANWLLDSKGVSVHFEHTDSFPYPNYPEEVIVEIPFADIKDIIRTDGPAAYLLPKSAQGTSTRRPIMPKVRMYDVLDDGQYYAFIKQISFCRIPEGEITFDMVEFLTGDAAVTAAKEDGEIPKEQDSIDNDYYVRNRNPLLRTFALSENPELKLLNDKSNLWQFAGQLNDTSAPMGSDQPYVLEDLFLLTIEKGKVVKIEMQYLP